MSYDDRLRKLLAGLDPAVHAVEIGKLRACRTLPDLERLSQVGFLTPEGPRTRVRLVRHGSGTFLLVAYEDGWTKSLSQG